MNNATPSMVLTWLSPEILSVASSIIVHVACSKLNPNVEQLELAEENSSNFPVQQQKIIKSKKKQFGVLVSIGRYVVLLTLCLAAVLRPSVLGGLYLLVFLASATWWACYKQLRKGFAILMRCLLVVVFCHISVLYAYQFQWPQEYLDRNSTYAR